MVLEGGILGASDTGYLGLRTAASCVASLLVLAATFITHGSLLGVWVGMKALNVAALAFDLAKFVGGRGKGIEATEEPPAPLAAKRSK